MEIARDRAPADRPFVYVNMIMTLDGRTAVDGRSAAVEVVAPASLAGALADLRRRGVRTLLSVRQAGSELFLRYAVTGGGAPQLFI